MVLKTCCAYPDDKARHKNRQRVLTLIRFLMLFRVLGTTFDLGGIVSFGLVIFFEMISAYNRLASVQSEAGYFGIGILFK